MRLQGELTCSILQAKLLTKPYLTLNTLQAGVTLRAGKKLASPAPQTFLGVRRAFLPHEGTRDAPLRISAGEASKKYPLPTRGVACVVAGGFVCC